MRPPASEVLAFLARALPGHACQPQSPYLAKQLALAGSILSIMAQDADRLVARLVEEAQAIRALFTAGATVANDPALRGELAQEAARSSDSLNLTELEAENDRLRALLIRLHAHVEMLTGDAARSLDEAIWRELVLQTERRRTRFLKI